MNQSSFEIICCGQAAYDLNFVIDQYPIEDQKYKIEQLIETSGGPAANAASLLANWGISTYYAGIVGNDIYGKLIIDELTASGVDIRLVQIDKTKKTPLSTVIVNTENGSRTLLNRRDENDQPAVTAEIIRTLKTMHPSVLHFDGHALNLSLTMMELFPNATVVIDAGSYREATDKLCKVADFVICSRRFAEECTGLDDIITEAGRQQCMIQLKKRYPGRVVVTLGADGLFYNKECGNNNWEVKTLPAFHVRAVDSTGAGDIFHAAFSYSLLKACSFKKRLKLASAAAALSVTKIGGRTSIPELEETLKLSGLQSLTEGL